MQLKHLMFQNADADTIIPNLFPDLGGVQRRFLNSNLKYFRQLQTVLSP